MSDKVADLLLRNLQEVFNERDAARRIAAVRSIYDKEAEFFEANVCYRGHDAISAKVGALQTSFSNDFMFTATSEPTRNHDLGRLTWRVGRPAAPPVATGMDIAHFKNGRIQSLYVFLGEAADKPFPVQSSEGASK